MSQICSRTCAVILISHLFTVKDNPANSATSAMTVTVATSVAAFVAGILFSVIIFVIVWYVTRDLLV